MTKKPRHKPMRFIITSALLIGPAVQGCDFAGDEPTGNELAPPVVIEPGVVAPGMPPAEVEEPTSNEMIEPGVEAPDPGVEAPDPGVEAPDEEVDDGTDLGSSVGMASTNAVSPR